MELILNQNRFIKFLLFFEFNPFFNNLILKIIKI